MLIIIAAHIPIFTLQRHEGRIFAPMAYSVVSALVGALVLSLTLVPLLCCGDAPEEACPDEDNRLVRARASGSTGRRSTHALKHPRVILIAAVARAGWRSLALVPRLGTEFLPELNEGAIWVNLTLPPERLGVRGAGSCTASAQRHPPRAGSGERDLQGRAAPRTAPTPSSSTWPSSWSTSSRRPSGARA